MNEPKAAGGLLSGNWLKWGLVATINIALLYVITLMYAQGEIAFALVILLLGSLGTWVFTSEKAYNFRYVYPSLLGVILFVVFPLIYTVNIAFTNYSSKNLLTFERVKEIHLDKTYRSGEESFGLTLFKKEFKETSSYQLELTNRNDSTQIFVTDAFIPSDSPVTVSALAHATPAGEKQVMREVIRMRSELKNLTVILPDERQLVMTSLREFGAMMPLFREGNNNELINNQTGEVIRPDFQTGFYINDNSQEIAPGFTVYIGWDNFTRVLTDPGIQGPFLCTRQKKVS